jgi:hypothetical protein
MLNARETSIANRTGSDLIIFSLKSLTSLQQNKRAGMKESNKLTLSNPIFLPTVYSPALICFGR